jgi:hypothetical protein
MMVFDLKWEIGAVHQFPVFLKKLGGVTLRCRNSEKMI